MITSFESVDTKLVIKVEELKENHFQKDVVQNINCIFVNEI
jgi:hypothetical protein